MNTENMQDSEAPKQEGAVEKYCSQACKYFYIRFPDKIECRACKPFVALQVEGKNIVRKKDCTQKQNIFVNFPELEHPRALMAALKEGRD